MSKQIQRPARVQPATGPSPQRPESGRRRTMVVMVPAGLAVLALVGYAAKRHFLPNYWTADDLGPARINDAKPPGPAPHRMVWIPGGVFWMGAGDFDNSKPLEVFADAKPLHNVYVDG